MKEVKYYQIILLMKPHKIGRQRKELQRLIIIHRYHRKLRILIMYLLNKWYFTANWNIRQNKNKNKNRRNRGKQQRQQRGTNQQPASQAFSYNLFEVTDNISVVCRCGIDGYIID